MGGVKLDIQGLDQINKLLNDLPKEITDKLALDINKKAGNIAKEEIQLRAPHANNDSILNAIKVKKGERNSDVIVGLDKSGYLGRFHEFGTKVRTTESGANRGAITRKPFFYEGVDAAVPAIIKFMQENYAKIINRAMKRLAKKAK